MLEDILRELKMTDRDEVVAFLKSLWREEPQPCPCCGGKLDFMHKKAKKNNSNWRCIQCGKVYKAINILDKLNEQ